MTYSTRTIHPIPIQELPDEELRIAWALDTITLQQYVREMRRRYGDDFVPDTYMEAEENLHQAMTEFRYEALKDDNKVGRFIVAFGVAMLAATLILWAGGW